MVLGVIAFAACGDDPADAVPETLELSFTGLEPLINGFHYDRVGDHRRGAGHDRKVQRRQ